MEEEIAYGGGGGGEDRDGKGDWVGGKERIEVKENGKKVKMDLNGD